MLQLAHQTAAHPAHREDFAAQACHIVRQHVLASFYVLPPREIPKPEEAPVEASDRRRESCQARF
jgi:hypothetical protein